MKTVVLTAPGRHEITRTMLAALERQNPGEPFEVFRAPGAGGKRDFWAMLDHAATIWPGDLLLLEDDIITARNFIAYARRWRCEHFTTFFNSKGYPPIDHPVGPATFFHFSQAIWIPERIVAKLTINGPTPPQLGVNQDDALGWELARLELRVWYHPSLVQHVGDQSLACPGEKLDGYRVARDFVGEGFDCLQLHKEGSAPVLPSY